MNNLLLRHKRQDSLLNCNIIEESKAAGENQRFFLSVSLVRPSTIRKVLEQLPPLTEEH